jgi:hypothetical protein
MSSRDPAHNPLLVLATTGKTVTYAVADWVLHALLSLGSYLQAEASWQPLGLLVWVALGQNGRHEHLQDRQPAPTSAQQCPHVSAV